MRLATIILSVGLSLIVSSATAQDAGSLLIASVQLEDEAFSETVILLVHHAEEGSVGVAINRPTWVSAREVFPRVDYLHAYRGEIFHGGPLAQATVLIMTRGLPPRDDTRPLVDDIYMHSNLDALETSFDRRVHDTSVLRFYAGHASWGPGQLEDELASGAWEIVPGTAALIFDPEPETLWRRLNERDAELTVERREPPTQDRGSGTLIVTR